MNEHNAIILARSNSGDSDIQQQVGRLKKLAAERGYYIVGTVGMPHTSANDPSVESVLTGLIARTLEGPQANTLLITDQSRIPRDVHRGMSLCHRLAAAGWKVIAADGSSGNDAHKFVQNSISGEKLIAGTNAKNKTARDTGVKATHVGRRGQRVRETAQHSDHRIDRVRASAKEKW